MVTANASLVGLGLYTPAEAARYARVRTETLTRWVYGTKASAPVIHAQLQGDPDRTVTFLDLVQVLAVRAIRRDYRVPLQKIREAVERAQGTYGVEYPFAMKHRTYLFDNEIHIRLPEREDLVQLSGTGRNQLVAHEIAELYMKDLAFSDDDLAVRYQPMVYHGCEIVIDPQQRFGQPFVSPGDYSVDVLVDAYKAEGGIDAAARAMDVSQQVIEAAIAYDDYLRGPQAA